ncbi:MAG: sulfotransferase [Cyclobacteriaceae bacterium]|nr:sulfotransferase [Cyclobacteriaceae bacterium]
MKRFFKLSILLLIFIIIELANYLGFLIDELIYPSYKKQSIKSPVFIVGMPRSGTTYLHTLLAQDTENFTTMRLWEILLAPSIIQKKIVIRLSKINKRLNNNLRKLLIRFDRKIFEEYSPIHPLSFFNIEEDDYLFFHIFTSGHLLFWFPSINWLYKNIKFDHELSESNKLRQLRYYRKCIKKHLFIFSNGRTYLAKSPLHTPRLNSLKGFFPDSVFIHNIRAPHEVIPSTISLFQMFSRVFYTPVEIETLTKWVLDIADHWYSYAYDQSKTLAEDRFINIIFSELIKDPKSEVVSIYKLLNYRLSKNFRNKLEHEVKATKAYTSKHTYSLNQYKLNKDQIEIRYKTTYHEYFSITNKPKTNVPVPLVTD